MANLFDRELKLLFTSPLLIAMEIASTLFLSVVIYNYKTDSFIMQLMVPVWMIIVFYSTFFELEVWRRNFLNKGVKLKLYVNTSEYTPFLMHSFASLVLLELKTLIVILVPSIQAPPFPNEIGFFILAAHAFWLFALSVGYIVSKEVLRKPSNSTAIFLCMLIFSAVAFSVTMMSQSKQPSGQASSHPFFSVFCRLDTFTLIVLFVSLLLYVLALFACSLLVRNIRIDDI
ncbi:MAG: hypothetical protein QXO47_08570 [Thermoproteota archaeon]